MTQHSLLYKAVILRLQALGCIISSWEDIKSQMLTSAAWLGKSSSVEDDSIVQALSKMFLSLVREGIPGVSLYVCIWFLLFGE